jgi:hypothetical protein
MPSVDLEKYHERVFQIETHQTSKCGPW